MPQKTSDKQYTLIRVVEPPTATWDGVFGSSLGLGDNRIVIGESGHGRVHIYDLNGNIIKTITAPVKDSSSNFGFSIAVNNDLVIIGEPGANVNGLKAAGLVHLYDKDGNYIKTIKSQSPYEGAGFGFSLAADNGIVAVGEPGPLNGDEELLTCVYLLNSNGSYLGHIERPQPRRGSFGWSVDVYKDIVAVGEPYAVIDSPAGGYTHGVVHLYNISTDPVLIASLRSPIGRGFGSFGQSVSIGEGLVVVGEIRGDVNNTQMAGNVHLFTHNGELLTTLAPPSPKVYGYFGFPVEVNDVFVLVGQRNGGFVYLYDNKGRLMVTISQKETSDDYFGEAIALSGDILAVGAPLSIVDGKKAGEVYIYELNITNQIADSHVLIMTALASIIVISLIIVLRHHSVLKSIKRLNFCFVD